MTNMIRLKTDELFSPRHLSINSLLSRQLSQPATKHRGESVKTCATIPQATFPAPVNPMNLPLSVAVAPKRTGPSRLIRQAIQR